MTKKLSRRWRRLLRRQPCSILLACAVMVPALIMGTMVLTPPQDHGLHYRGPITIGWLSPAVLRWKLPIERYSRQYDIDANMVAIIVTLESNGNPQATSRVGAQGLMQIMPATGADINDKLLITPRPKVAYNLYDPVTNIEFGAAYLAHLRNTFGPPSKDEAEYVKLIAAGYNGGPGAATMLEHNQPRGTENTNYANGAALLWQNRQAATAPTIYR